MTIKKFIFFARNCPLQLPVATMFHSANYFNANVSDDYHSFRDYTNDNRSLASVFAQSWSTAVGVYLVMLGKYAIYHQTIKLFILKRLEIDV